MFRNQVQGTSRALFGAYDQFGQPEGNKYTLYRLYFFMRKWFTPMFVNRLGFQSVYTKPGNKGLKLMPRYDWALGKTVKGFYITSLQAMTQIVITGGKKAKYLTTEEKIALKKMGAETLFITAFALLASILFGYDEDDEDNYMRTNGYVEDGAGNGDKEEDTMLAQLADGEFVTRTDGVLGAGILAGASPKDPKEMRKLGAEFFL